MASLEDRDASSIGIECRPEMSPEDFATVGALVLVVICSVSFIAWVRWVKPALTQLQATAEKAASDAAVTREHTENSHANAENPNLRDDLDAKFKGITEALGKLDAGQTHLATMLARVEDAQRRQDRELARIQEVQAADRADTRRVREALDEHISDKRDFAPRLAEVERELKTHRKKTETPESGGLFLYPKISPLGSSAEGRVYLRKEALWPQLSSPIAPWPPAQRYRLTEP